MGGRGFTLVELLVVLAVGAILLAIAFPGYAFLVNSSRLAAVTNELVSAIQLARSEAVKRGTRVTVCKTDNAMAAMPACNTAASWQQGWLVFVDGGTRGVVDTGDTLLRLQDRAPVAVTITASNYSTYISYKPSGISQGPNNLANGKLYVCVAGEQRDIVVNSTGRVRLEFKTC
ncbi:GspH/FimT family pseudopilin [Thiobacillus sp.]